MSPAGPPPMTAHIRGARAEFVMFARRGPVGDQAMYPDDPADSAHSWFCSRASDGSSGTFARRRGPVVAMVGSFHRPAAFDCNGAAAVSANLGATLWQDRCRLVCPHA